MAKVQGCEWIYDYLDLRLRDGQEFATDLEDAVDGILDAVSVWDEESLCYRYADLDDEQMASIIDDFSDRIWDRDGNQLMKSWRVAVTTVTARHDLNRIGRFARMGSTVWADYDNIDDAETAFESIVDAQLVELIEIDHKDGERSERVIESR